jgi:hypothetical protein
MLLHTASEGISFAKTLEATTAQFYEAMAQRFSEFRDRALAHAAENRRFAGTIQRVYQEVITDAIEGCYCFQLETEDFGLPVADPVVGSVHEAVGQAIAVEKIMVDFYSSAKKQADTLMADIPRAFGVIIRKRNQRLEELESTFLESQGGGADGPATE